MMQSKLRVLVGLIALSLFACNNPVSNPTSITPGPQTSGLQLGSGLTVYAGMVDQSASGDTYHTGLMVYANGANGWKQLMNSAVTVKDISVDSSGNIAVATPSAVMYLPKGGSWSSSSVGGTVNQVLLQGSNVFAATSVGLTKSAVPSLSFATNSFTDVGGDSNVLSLASYSTSLVFVGTSSGLYSTNGTATPVAVAVSPKPLYSAAINGLLGGTSSAYAATSLGFSSYNGSSWTDVSAAAIGLGTPLCVTFANSPTATVYLGTSLGMALSSNNGSTWPTKNQVNMGTSVTSIAVATAGGDTCIYAATPQGLYVYSYGQQSWSLVFSGFPVNKVVVTVP